MLTLDTNLFLEFIGTTWTLEGRREAGTVIGYATRVTGQTYTLQGNRVLANGRAVRKGEVPGYVLAKLRKLIAECKENAGFFDCYVVAIDLNIDAADKGIVKGIRQVFVMDRNRHVHACELTPSYELHHLYDTMVFHDNVDYPDDERIQELAEKYETNYDTDVEYHHVSTFDRYIANNPNRVQRIGGYAVKYDGSDEGEGIDETDYEEVLEYIIDHYRGNHVF
jgi:hypothetical protein